MRLDRSAGAPGPGSGAAGAPAEGSCSGCLIGGFCRTDGSANPDNPCTRCDASASTSTWVSNDGAACDDGLFCNGADTCGGGGCTEHAGDACPAGFACSEVHGQCCAAAASVGCGAAGDVVQLDSCGREEQVLEQCVDGNGVCRDGVCGCAAGWTGPDCQRCLVYVSATRGDDSLAGRSWPTAKATVQAGLDAGEPGGCEIWVAAGTYLPTTGTDRDAIIELREGVDLHGGFAGDEYDRDQRDIDVNLTVLSGDIGVQGDTQDNSYAIIAGADDAILDGFTITAGRGLLLGAMQNLEVSPTVRNCTFEANEGGAMFNRSTAVVVEDCLFRDNSGAYGTAAYNQHHGSARSTPTFQGCTFSNNEAVWGGALHAEGGDLIVEDCRFEGNYALEGGAIAARQGNLTIRDSVFRRNSPIVERGGAIWASGESVEIFRSTFTYHSASDAGGAIYIAGSGTTASLYDCIFVGNAARFGGAVAMYEVDSAVFASALFLGNSADADGGAIHLNHPSWALTLRSSQFRANQAGGDGGACHVAGDDGVLSVASATFEGNVAGGDGGALDVAAKEVTLANSTFLHNTAAQDGGAVSLYATTAAAPFAIRESIFSGNFADRGGAGRLEDQNAWIENCLFDANAATSEGGALYVAGTATVGSSTLHRNAAPVGGALSVVGATPSGPALIRNSVVWDHRGSPDQLAGTVDVHLSDVQGYSGGSANLDADPAFVNADRAAGPLDLHLAEGSPGIDWASTDAPLTDLNGAGRRDDPAVPNANGARADIGAYETHATECGDGAVDLGSEDCDDGNLDADDGCGADCRCEREGRGPGCPARSCAELLAGHPDVGDGLYWLRPSGHADAFLTFCDMTRAGGGWTLVAVYGYGPRPPEYHLAPTLPRPGATWYGEPSQGVFDPDENDWWAAHFSIDAAALWDDSATREVLAYVGGTTDDYVTAALPAGCNFFDYATICAENTWGPFDVWHSDGTLLTAEGFACTTDRANQHEEFGLHLLEGHDDTTAHCSRNRSSSLGHADLGRIFTTFEDTANTYWNVGVHSHWNESGDPNQVGALLIR